MQPAAGAHLTKLARTSAQAEKLLQIGDLSKATRKTVRAIHHYEELGLIKPDARSKGRFRLYDSSAVTRVRWIGKLADLGMSLVEIQQVVAAWEGAPSAARAMSDVRATYRQRLEETRAQIARLTLLERELEASIDYLDTCDSCDPALSMFTDSTVEPNPLEKGPLENAQTCSACQLREREVEPDLVAGIVA